MFDHEQGRPEAHAPRPGITHYRISETTHLHLQVLAAALHGLTILADPAPTDRGTDFQDRHAAPIFARLGDYTDRLIADCALVLAPTGPA